MPRYVIHVGPHKTGSTYLQVQFQNLAPHLKARGILYPAIWLDSRAPGHVRLAERLRSGTDAGLADEFALLNSSSSDVVLISSEDLTSLPVESLALLKSYVADHQVSIVYYCRRWLEILPSAWQETVKHGHTTSIPEFMTANLINPYASHILNYAHQLDRFELVFGPESLSLVSYSNVIERGMDLGQHFFRSFLSWPNVPAATGPRPNASIGVLDIELIRALNVTASIRGRSRSAELRSKYLLKKKALDLSLIFAAMERHPCEIRFNENFRGLKTLHEEIFEKYGVRLILPRSGLFFFQQKQGLIEYVKPDYLLEPGVAETLRATYETLVS
jgi:hypothetical protein